MKFILKNDVLLRTEPKDLTTSDGKLYKGDVVFSSGMDKVNSWHNIRTSEGKSGWIFDTYLELYNDENDSSEVGISNTVDKKMDEQSIIEKILKENDLIMYVDLLIKNKLVSLEILNEINEDDYEKIGVDVMGDRKKFVKIFYNKREKNEHNSPKHNQNNMHIQTNYLNNEQKNGDKPNSGYTFLSFLIPVVGLILYLVWKEDYPKRARSCFKGMMWGFLTGIILTIIYTCI